MPLWNLVPVDPDDRNWAASTFKGDVIVRAPDELQARRLAARAFGIATSHKVGELIRMVPWAHADLVTSTKTDESSYYLEAGDDGIVWPPKAVDSDHTR